MVSFEKTSYKNDNSVFTIKLSYIDINSLHVRINIPQSPQSEVNRLEDSNLDKDRLSVVQLERGRKNFE